MQKVALVTGGAAGIGRTAALAFARAGARVVIGDVDSAGAQHTAEEIQELGGEAIAIAVDVSVDQQVEHMVMQAVRAYGKLDWAFNNAGISTKNFVPIAEFSEKEWDEIIATNLKSVWLCMKHECKQMLPRNYGVIVNTSSMLGIISRPGHSAYSAAKAGVLGLTRSVALDYARQGIRVNAICPGPIHTRMTSGSEEMLKRLTEQAPMGRLGTPEEIANTAVWLCSDASSYITAQAITVDGGFTTF